MDMQAFAEKKAAIPKEVMAQRSFCGCDAKTMCSWCHDLVELWYSGGKERYEAGGLIFEQPQAVPRPALHN